VSEYVYHDTYPFPLPAGVKAFLIAHTYAGAYLNGIYDGTLRRLHLRSDYVDDILKGFGGYQTRFRRDLANMNKYLLAQGLPPLVAMVLDQYPAYGGPAYKIAKIAEKAVVDAGAKLLPTEDYYMRYNGQGMNVSRWEGHPNEIANIIWANMITKELENRKDLDIFKR